MKFSVVASKVEFSGAEALSVLAIVRISLLTPVLLLVATG